MTILTKLSNLLTSAIELPNALHACVEMAREADYSRHELAKLPSELNEELEQKQGNLDLWRSWAVSMSGLGDDTPSWQLRDEIKRKLADDDGAQICGTLAARIVELEKELDLAKDENRALDLRRKMAIEELDRFIAWASPLAQSLPGTVCGDYVSDTIRDHIRSLTDELARAKCNLSDMAERYSRAAEMASGFERALNSEREARRWRKQSEEPAPFGKNVMEKYRDESVAICSGQLVYVSSEWRYLSPEDMPDNQ